MYILIPPYRYYYIFYLCQILSQKFLIILDDEIIVDNMGDHD